MHREVATVVATNEWKSLRLRLSVMVGSEVPLFKKSIDRQALKVTKTIGALVVESSGETPQKAAVDDRSYMPDTNPRKLPQLRVVESTWDARD